MSYSPRVAPVLVKPRRRIHFLAGINRHFQNAWVTVGAQYIDLSRFPTASGANSRSIDFKAVLKAEAPGVWPTESRLVDALTLTQISLLQSLLPHTDEQFLEEFGLPTGTVPGTVRTDIGTLYYVQTRVANPTPFPSAELICSGAWLDFEYGA